MGGERDAAAARPGRGTQALALVVGVALAAGFAATRSGSRAASPAAPVSEPPGVGLTRPVSPAYAGRASNGVRVAVNVTPRYFTATFDSPRNRNCRPQPSSIARVGAHAWGQPDRSGRMSVTARFADEVTIDGEDAVRLTQFRFTAAPGARGVLRGVFRRHDTFYRFAPVPRRQFAFDCRSTARFELRPLFRARLDVR